MLGQFIRGLCVAVGLLLDAGGAPAADFKGGVPSPPRPAPDFVLRSAVGDTFRLSEQRGKVAALSFGYTFCPDVCPTTMAELVQARDRLGASRREFRVVFVTVDPERDTPPRLRRPERCDPGGGG